MIIKAHQRLAINMGNFESYEVNRSIEIDTENDKALIREWLGTDDVVSEEDVLDLGDVLGNVLDRMLLASAKEAALLTDHADSFIHPYVEDHSK